MVSVEKLKADIDKLHGMLEEKLDEYVELAPEEKYKQAEILARCHELIDAIGKLQAIRPNPRQEVREGDVGTLTESLMADDTAGFSHRIPAGMEIKVARVEPKFIGFHTSDVIEGENYFITPLTLEFRRKFRKRGTRKFKVWFTTPTGFERFVDVEAIDEGEAKRLAEKQVPAGSEFRYVTEISSYAQKTREALPW